MPSVDQRIVEMQFDNKQFNSGIQTTMSALDKLKASLNFQGVGEAARNTLVALDKVDLSAITSGIGALQDRFSTFGVVGMQIIQNLTNTVMQFGKNLWNNTFGIIKTKGLSRATNIENAKFMLQGLVSDGEEVKKILAQASESVNDTAYGYDEAAKAAGQFAASGIGSGDLLNHALRGITGVAATTNSAYEDIARIFTTVSGNGRLMGDQLMQLSSRGLNVAATLTKTEEFAGKTEKEIRDMVSKGQISFEQFANAMDEAFGAHAKKANETFNGAMSNMKAALGRIGADWYTPFLEQNSTTVKTIVSLKEALVDVKNIVTTPLANGFLPWIAGENGLISKARNNIEQFKKSIESVKDEYSERIKKIGDTLGKAFNTLYHAFRGIGFIFDYVLEPIKEVFGIINSDGSKVVSTLDKVEAAVNQFSKIIQNFKDHVWNEWINIERGEWITELAVTFRALYAIVLLLKDTVSELIHDLLFESGTLSTVFNPIIGGLAKLAFTVKNIVVMLHNSDFIYKIIGRTVGALDILIKLVSGVFNSIDKAMGGSIVNFRAISEFLQKILDISYELYMKVLDAKTIDDLPKGLRAIADILIIIKTAIELAKRAIVSFVKVFGQPILNLIQTVLDPLLDILHDVSESFKDWGINFIQEDGFMQIFETILGVMRSVIDFGKRIVTMLITIFSGIYEFLSPIFTDIGSFISGLKESFKEKFHSKYFDGLGESIDNVKKKFHPLQAVLNGIKKIFEVIGSVIERLKPIFSQLGTAIGGLLGQLGSTIIDGLKGKGWDTFVALLNGTLLAGTVASFQRVSKSLGDALRMLNLKDLAYELGWTSFKTSVLNNLDVLKNTLVQYQALLKAEVLLKIASAVAILAGSLWLLSSIDAKDLSKSIAAIGTLMTELAASMSVLMKIGKAESIVDGGVFSVFKSLASSMKDFLKYYALGKLMLMMASSILILAVAVTMLASLPTEQMQAGLFALGIIMLSVMAMLGVLSMVSTKIKGFKSGIFVSISIGILLIAASLKMLASINKEEMNTALTALVAIFGVFSLLMIVVEALEMLDTKFGQGKLNKSIKSIGKAFEEIAVALLVVSVALKIMSTINPEQMSVALIGMVGSLAMMTLALAALASISTASGAKFVAIGASLLIVANAMIVLSIALKIMSSMSLDEMQVALLSMVGVLASIALFFYAFGEIKGTTLLKTSAALVIMAAALIALTIPLKIFSKMSLEEICKALLMLVGTLLSVTAVAVLMATWAPTILYFASSLVVLGVAMLAISTAIFLFSAAIASLAVSGPLGVAALGALLVEIVAFIPLMLAGFLAAVNQLLPQIFMMIQTVVTYIIGLIIEILFVEVPKILDGLSQLLSQIFDFLILHIPEFFAVLGVLVNELADFLVETGIPRAVEVVGTLISEVLTYVKDHIEDWAYDLCVIISGVFDGLAKGVPMLVDSIGGFLIDVLNAVGDWLYDNADSVADALLNVVEGVFYAAATLASKIFTKITDFLYDTFVKPIKEFFGINSPSTLMAEIGENIIQGLFNGITGLIDILTAPVQAIIDLFQGLIDKAGDVGEAAYDALHGPITGEYTGELKEQDDDARKRAQTAFETGDTSQLEGNDKANYYYLQLKNQGDFYNELYPTGYNNGQALIDGTKDALADGAAGIGEEGKKAVWSYADTMQAHLEDAKKAGKDVSDASLMAVKNAKIHYGEAGTEHAISYADTMKAHVQEAKKSGTLLASGASTAVNSKSSEFKTAGSNSGTWFSRGISSTRSSVETAAKAVAEAGIAKIQDTKDRFKDTGKYLLLGLKEGLEDREYIQAIRNAAGNVSYVAADEMRKAGVIQSPSKVTMQIGRYFLEGLAIGLSENDIVAESAQDTAQTVLSTLSSAFDKVEELSDGLTVSPSITPVLDMNNVDTGLLSSMLSANRTMTMSGDLQVNDTRSNLALLNALNNLEKNGNRDVVTALNVLSGNVAQYTDAVRNMRIVMDSGTLVGEIGEAMDYRLGSIDNYRQRGMM